MTCQTHARAVGFPGGRPPDFRCNQSNLNPAGVHRLGRPHVAVQIDPEEGRLLDPWRARRYLEKYFEGERFKIYWGSSEDFLKRLWQAWQEHHAQDRPR